MKIRERNFRVSVSQPKRVTVRGSVQPSASRNVRVGSQAARHFSKADAMIRAAILSVLGTLLTVQATVAQTTDYDGMLAQALQQSQNLSYQMANAEQAIVTQNLAHPQVQMLYQQHRMQGGGMSPQQFAYMYAATAGFTPDGTRRFRQTEMVNQANEASSYQGYLAAQRARGLAQQNYADRFQANNAEFGNLLQGNSTWYGGWNGGATVLPHTLPNHSYYDDQGTGNSFYQDNQGQFHQQGQNGDWYGMYQ